MLKNLEVKEFLSRLTEGIYALRSYLMPAFPTINPRTATVSNKTSDYTITDDDLIAPTIFTNSTAGGQVVFTLPAVLESKAKVVRVSLLAAQAVRFDPQRGEIVNYNGDAVIHADATLAGVIGNYMELFCDGVQWIVTEVNGVLTKAVSSSVSPSISPSQSPSVSTSPSVSLSPSISPSTSPSSSTSPSVSLSPSKSPSTSPSVSLSPSISPSASV